MFTPALQLNEAEASVVGGFVGQARHEDEVDVGQEPTGKPVQPAESLLRQRGVPTCLRGGLLAHHGGGGAFREPETWAICRSNKAVDWS